MEKLEGATEKALIWFKNNGMKMNSDKCHLLISGHKHEVFIANVGGKQVIESNKVRLFGIDLDSKLSFTDHLDNILCKASSKLNALSRLCVLLPFHRKRTLMHAFILSQFKHCPLIWMCHNRGMNHKINNLHCRALRMVYNDYVSSFDQLLEKMALLLYTSKIYVLWQLRCLKWKMILRLLLCLIFSQKIIFKPTMFLRAQDFKASIITPLILGPETMD